MQELGCYYHGVPLLRTRCSCDGRWFVDDISGDGAARAYLQTSRPSIITKAFFPLHTSPPPCGGWVACNAKFAGSLPSFLDGFSVRFPFLPSFFFLSWILSERQPPRGPRHGPWPIPPSHSHSKQPNLTTASPR